MKRFHYIKFRLIVKSDENYDEIMQKMQNLLEVDFKKDKINVEEVGATGALDNEIRIIEIFLKKARHTNAFAKKMIVSMSEEDKNIVIEEIDLRIDEDCDFFIRFDKESIFLKNEFKLINGGNCLHVKFSIASYPKKRDIAKGVVEELFNAFSN